MLEGLKKDKNEEGKARSQKRKESKKEKQLQQEILKAKEEQERLDEEAKQLQAEKDRLLALDYKGLMVELIFAIRGLYNELNTVKEQQEKITASLKDMDSDLAIVGLQTATLNLDNTLKK